MANIAQTAFVSSLGIVSIGLDVGLCYESPKSVAICSIPEIAGAYILPQDLGSPCMGRQGLALAKALSAKTSRKSPSFRERCLSQFPEHAAASATLCLNLNVRKGKEDIAALAAAQAAYLAAARQKGP